MIFSQKFMYMSDASDCDLEEKTQALIEWRRLTLNMKLSQSDLVWENLDNRDSHATIKLNGFPFSSSFTS